MKRLSEILNGNSVWWRWCTNGEATRAWRREGVRLSAVQSRVVDELKRNGVARTCISELLGDAPVWLEMHSAFEDLERASESQIRETRENADKPGYKAYLVELLGKAPVLDPSSVFVRFALQRPVLDIANAYFGMYVRLRQFNVWHNVPVKAEPRNSQLWHRDPGDRQILRLFAYLGDVGPGAGALSYVAGSHELGALRVAPEACLENTTWRSTDEQMERAVTRERWVTATGERGTIWFVDTRGYHKGGHATGVDRLAYNAMWTSRANRRAEYFTRSLAIGAQSDPAVAYALGVGPAGAPARSGGASSSDS
ncbi:MAG: phytanoyl-CoA dioxygenase family protein [Planctomycetes bacterium]|nr:phytanoyl-CoA dioxygenase family protein [Planctomycetota bacterium]